MRPPDDHYAVLGIPRTATAAEIRRAYHRLARAHHPDLASAAEKETATARFQAIQRAYHVLGHTKRRAAYDQRLALPDLGELLAMVEGGLGQGLDLLEEVGAFGGQAQRVIDALQALLGWHPQAGQLLGQLRGRLGRLVTTTQDLQQMLETVHAMLKGAP